MNDKLISYIESSFLSPLLGQDYITDITYNGVSIFYMHNKEGRKKSNIKVITTEVLDFIRQIANFSEKQFSFLNPFLDVSAGKYRINAVHPSLVRVKNEKSCSFAIRIGSEESRVMDDYEFVNKKCREYLQHCLMDGKSIVIGGKTGTGKTELQKYLLMSLPSFTRVIVIDNVEELEFVRANEELDLTSWQISTNNQNANIQELVKNALRSNPDWLVVAEARGKEMNEVLNSVMTGHPIITTVHGESIEDIPNRICRMVEMADISQKHDSVLSDIFEHLKVYVFLKRVIDSKGHVVRYVESIAETQKDKTLKIIYRKE